MWTYLARAPVIIAKIISGNYDNWHAPVAHIFWIRAIRTGALFPRNYYDMRCCFVAGARKTVTIYCAIQRLPTHPSVDRTKVWHNTIDDRVQCSGEKNGARGVRVNVTRTTMTYDDEIEQILNPGLNE